LHEIDGDSALQVCIRHGLAASPATKQMPERMPGNAAATTVEAGFSMTGATASALSPPEPRVSGDRQFADESGEA
jgi:hypothetical protein